MDPINPWVDAAEMRRLAERLLTPSHQADPPHDAGFDAEFVGFAEDLSETAPPTEVPAAVEEVPPPPIVIEQPPAIIESPFQPVFDPPPQVRGPFLDRMSQFRDWFMHEFPATGLFILDREGHVIFDEGGNDKVHSLARNLALSSRKPGSPPTNVRVKIGPHETLEVVPADTAYGYLVLGAIVPEALHPAAIAVITDGIIVASAPPA